MNSSKTLPAKILWIALACCAVVVLNIPFLTALWTSVKSNADLSQNPLRWPTQFTFEHYLSIFSRSDFNFTGYFINSVSLSTGAVALTAVLGVPAAYAIVKLGVGGQRLLALVTSIRIVPAIFLMLPFFLLLNVVGLLDTPTALIIANAVVNLPLVMLIYSAALRGIPDSIEDAGKLDGCSPARILVSLMIPILRPAIASAALLTFVFSWSDYLFGLVLTSQRAVPLTVGAANFVTSAGIQWGDLAAAASLSVVPPLLVAILAQRHFVRGLSAGAIKG
jgi:multiple sugar transport system permease protein